MPKKPFGPSDSLSTGDGSVVADVWGYPSPRPGSASLGSSETHTATS